MPLDGEYQLPPDSTLFGTALDALPRDDLDLALTEITAALDGYQHAEQYDSVNLWEQNMLSREGRTLRQADIEYDANLCSPVIDAVNDRLIITSWGATAGTVTDTKATDAATSLVNQIVTENELNTRYRDWNRKTLRDGDAYVIVWPTQPAEVGDELSGDHDIADLATGALGVNITYGDPRQCRMFYDPENPRKKLFFAQMWEFTVAGERKPRIRMNLFYPDRIEKWISAPGDRQKRAKQFAPFIDPDQDNDNDYPGSGADPDNDPAPASSWPMPNPYGVVPVFHLRTAYEYGKPEHRNAFAPQDALAKLLEMLMVTVEFNGYPQRYAIQQADSLGTQSIREDPLAEHSPADWDHDFTETALSTTSIVSGAISNETGANYEANPGGMQVYKGFESVGTFTTANPAAFLDPMTKAAELVSACTGTPAWKFSGLGSQPPSGLALRVAESSLVQKCVDRMAMLGGTWEDILEFAALILGHTVKVSISWVNPGSNDSTELWQLVKLMVELGVPRQQAFMRAGVPEAEAAEWATTYDDVFAMAAQQQSRALTFQAQAELLQQQAVAAKIANGIPLRQVYAEAGYSEADIDSWLAEKAAELDLGRRITLLGQLSTAIQSLGTGVSLGVLPAPGANAIVLAMVEELLPTVDLATLEMPDDETDDEDENPAPLPLSITPDMIDPMHLPPAMLPPGATIAPTVPDEPENGVDDDEATRELNEGQ